MIKLSDKILDYRADRPDEWTMDNFIRDARKLEHERDTLTEALASLLETVEWVAEEHGVEVYADLCEAAGKACEALEGISSGGKNIL